MRIERRQSSMLRRHCTRRTRLAPPADAVIEDVWDVIHYHCPLSPLEASAFINAQGRRTETNTSNDTHRRSLPLTRPRVAWTMKDDDACLQLSCAMTLQSDVAFDAPLLRALWECQERFKCVKFSLEHQDTLCISQLSEHLIR